MGPFLQIKKKKKMSERERGERIKLSICSFILRMLKAEFEV